MIRCILSVVLLLFISCRAKVEKVKPSEEPISESVYASGVVKSWNQYEVFSSVNGIIESVLLNEGDSVSVGTLIMIIAGEPQRIGRKNAMLAERFSDAASNSDKLEEANQNMQLARAKMLNDSILYFRQLNLWKQKVGTQLELEQRELAYQGSKTNFISAGIRLRDLKKEIEFHSSQAKNNLLLSDSQEDDFTIRSKINGIIYSLNKKKGELAGVQLPLAIIGDPSRYVLEMQVDENDITKVKPGQNVVVALDSYKDKVFDASVTKINPLMNGKSKTFLVEAEFVNQPEVLYPNLSFEANIVIQSKEKALLIPRSFVIGDSLVVKGNGDTIKVRTGLRDYQRIEIVSGINANDELINPFK
jgi:HlyD family secretion protein